MNTPAKNIKTAAVGKWQSLTTEVRPGATRNENGTPKPLYLSRNFELHPDDRFELVLTTYADATGTIPLALIKIAGHLHWQGAHPIAEGAQKVDFIADEDYLITPLLPDFANLLNQYTQGFEPWETNQTQRIFKKAFPPFGLAEGQVFKEYDLIYLEENRMFWGARHPDGRGFDSEENRPVNLQIPMKRQA